MLTYVIFILRIFFNRLTLNNGLIKLHVLIKQKGIELRLKFITTLTRKLSLKNTYKYNIYVYNWSEICPQ